MFVQSLTLELPCFCLVGVYFGGSSYIFGVVFFGFGEFPLFDLVFQYQEIRQGSF